MKRASSLVFGFLVLGFAVLCPVSAQDRVAVTFKTFPPEYELFYAGDRLPYSTTDEGLRTYYLPAGTTRINLTAPGSAPLSLGLTVKAGMPVVQAKLEPRVGPLTIVGETATGKLPRNLAFSTDGKKLFVALQGEPGIDVFEVPSLKKSGRLAPPDGTGGFTDVLAVGSEIWAVQTDGRIHAFNAATLAYKDSKDITGGGNAFLTDLGQGRVAVANWDTFQVSALDDTTRAVQAALSVGGNLRGFTADRGTAWVSLFDSGKVAAIDTATWKVKGTLSAGRAPRPVAVDGPLLFVGDMANAQVIILDTASGKTVGTVPVGSNPVTMEVSPDKTLVAVASRGRNNPVDYQLPGPEYGRITVLDAKGNVVGGVWGRNQPTGMAFSPDGKYLAFTDFLDNNLELYRVIPAKSK